MPSFNSDSHNASSSHNAEDKEFMRMQRNADVAAVCMAGMVVSWFGWLIVSLIELGV